MSPIVIDVRHAEDLRDVVHRAVQALVEGGLVVFPTETVYGVAASALEPAAGQRLVDLKQRKAGNPLALAVRSAEDARDYVPDMTSLAQRLARRCWPGPITMVVDDAHPDGLRQQPGGSYADRGTTRMALHGASVPGRQTQGPRRHNASSGLVRHPDNRVQKGSPEAHRNGSHRF